MQPWASVERPVRMASVSSLQEMESQWISISCGYTYSIIFYHILSYSIIFCWRAFLTVETLCCIVYLLEIRLSFNLLLDFEKSWSGEGLTDIYNTRLELKTVLSLLLWTCWWDEAVSRVLSSLLVSFCDVHHFLVPRPVRAEWDIDPRGPEEANQRARARAREKVALPARIRWPHPVSCAFWNGE